VEVIDPFESGCPSCGSSSIHRVEPLRADQVDDLKLIDQQQSGVFMCGRCHYEDVVVLAAPKVLVPIYPVWSKTCRCPKCRSWETKIVATQDMKNCRVHKCQDCQERYFTNMIERGRPSTLAGYADYAVTARCGCGSWDTKLSGQDLQTNTREHTCRSCRKVFRTSMSDRR
jgi:hypothetical protein